MIRSGISLRSVTLGRTDVDLNGAREGEFVTLDELDRLEELEWVALDEVQAWRIDRALRATSLPRD
jgi:hypothetical protein